MRQVWRHLWRFGVGIAFLALVFWWVLPLLAWPLLPLMFLSGGPAPLNIVWIAVVAALIGFGLKRRQPAYVVAPVVYFIAWYAVSYNMRLQVEGIERNGNFAQAIPAGTSDDRTLIIDGSAGSDVSRHAVANGTLDRLVKVSRDDKQQIKAIVEMALGRGEQCSPDDIRAADDLRSVGRLDECYRSRNLDSVPDGLQVSYHYKVDIAHGAVGCCNELRVARRKQGVENLLIVWRQGYAVVLSYWPFLGAPGMFLIRQNGVWDEGAGPWHTVHYGAPILTSRAIVSAIYGNGFEAPPTAPGLSPTELLDRAELLSDGKYPDPRSLASLLKQAKSGGPVDDRWLRVAAALIGRDSYLNLSISDVLANLTLDQKLMFSARVLDRLETPGVCKSCFESAFSWPFLRGTKDSEPYIRRAQRIFDDGGDLQPWQFEAALRIMMANGPSPGTTKYTDLGRELFKTVLSAPSPGFAARALAYKRLFRGQDDTERQAQRAAVITRLDDVADDLLEKFVVAFWPGGDLLQTSPEAMGQIGRLCDRIARVSDPMTRRMIHGRVRCR